MLRHVNESQFNDELAALVLPLVVQFSASWCAPCHKMTPEVESAAEALDGRIDFVKVDIDQAGAIARRYSVRTVPTLVLLVRSTTKEIVEAKRMVGATRAGAIVAWSTT